MRPPGNAAEAFCARAEAQCAIEKLKQKPPAEKQHRRENKIRSENKRRDNRLDPGMRKEPKISAHHAGDRSARADGRHLRTQVGVNVHQCRRDAARQVKQQKSSPTQSVLDIVAENPERPHVAKQVQPTAVKKHRAEERQDLFAQTERLSNFRNRVTHRYDRQFHERPFQSTRPQLQFPEKNQRIDRDDGKRRRRKPA